MKVIKARNVNDALLLGIDLFNSDVNYRVQQTRNGTTYEALEPVTTVYSKPCERVCLIKERDANPFFHFIESLWMLAGRKDLKPLTYFVKSMENFSDDGETLWGAYGWRWKSYFGKDQLPLIINMLKKDPNDRRAVLQMWDAKYDLNRKVNKAGFVSHSAIYPGKDVPCNTNIYFKVRDNKLNMTVCNRSNDMLWGAYGANVVHMSILQEYMASAIGVAVGVYRQVSDSFHVYLNPVWDKVKHIEINFLNSFAYGDAVNPYDTLQNYKNIPLFTDTDNLHSDLDLFFNTPFKGQQHPFRQAFSERISQVNWANPLFPDIAIPMRAAYLFYKEKDFKASYKMIDLIKALDWKTACLDWLRKREKSFVKKAEKGKTHE